MNTDIKLPSSFFIGKARAVYLVNDASDEALLRGTGNNVYRTFQAAYDAANALQVSLGGTNQVVIMVGNTVAATVGNLVLTAAFNSRVSIQGINSTNSAVGSITGALNLSMSIKAFDISLGAVTGSGTSSVVLNVNHTIISGITVVGGSVQITGADSKVTGNIAMSNAGTVGNFAVSASNNLSLGSVFMTQTDTTAPYNIGGFAVYNSKDITFGSLTIRNSYTAGITTTGGIIIDVYCKDIVFTNNISVIASNAATPSDSVISNIVMTNTTVYGYVAINMQSLGYGFVGGGYIYTLTIDSCTFYSIVKIGYNCLTPLVSVTPVDITNCKSTGVNEMVIHTYNFSHTSLAIEDVSMPLYLFNSAGGLSFADAGSTINITNCSEGLSIDMLGEAVGTAPIINIDNYVGNCFLTRQDYSLEINIRNCNIAEFIVDDQGTTQSNPAINIYNTNIDNVTSLTGMFALANYFNIYNSSIFIRAAMDFPAYTCSNSSFSNNFAGVGTVTYYMYSIQNCVFDSYDISGIIMDEASIGIHQNVSYTLAGLPVLALNISAPTTLNPIYRVVNITSGTFTQGGITNQYAFADIIFKNSGTGIVTLSLGTSIDGLPSYTLLGGSAVRLFYDLVSLSYKSIS